MAAINNQIREGCIVLGTLFNEPMRVETIRASGDGAWTMGLVGTQSERFRKVTLNTCDIEGLTNCGTIPTMQEPIKDPAHFPWHGVIKVAHYLLEVNAMTRPMQVRESEEPYGGNKT